MQQGQEQEIAALLREGLDHYGVDDVESAVACWQRALELDPENSDALDYIEAAGREGGEDGAGAASQLDESERGFLHEAMRLAADGDLTQAYALVEGATTGVALDFETATVVELLRGRLLPVYRATFEPQATPRLAQEPDAIARFNLPPSAGFLVSLCDGHTAVEDLVSLSGMDAFEALHNLKGLLDSGLVSVDA